jgi:hypothetical protein
MSTNTLQSEPHSPAATRDRSVATRAMEIGAVVALAITGWVHLMDMSDKFSEVAYLGIGYGLIVIAAIASIVLILRGDRRGWMLGGGMCLATILGYTLSRTTGLPASTDDIGNWSETLAVWAGVAEIVMVVLAGVVLFGRQDATTS